MWVSVSHLQDGRNKSVLGIVGGGGNYPERRLAQSSLFSRSRRLPVERLTQHSVARGLARSS